MVPQSWSLRRHMKTGLLFLFVALLSTEVFSTFPLQRASLFLPTFLDLHYDPRASLAFVHRGLKWDIGPFFKKELFRFREFELFVFTKTYTWTSTFGKPAWNNWISCGLSILCFWLADAGGGCAFGHCSIPGTSPNWSWETAQDLRPGQKEAASQVWKQGKRRRSSWRAWCVISLVTGLVPAELYPKFRNTCVVVVAGPLTIKLFY